MGNTVSFGRLIRKSNLREVWEREAGDFTPWLARPENLQLLAEALYLEQLTLEATEHDVGRFSADIVARDTDGLVLIENQIEATDHRHLGQILTYLAGLEEAATVVWIARQFLEEHRAAIDWLNANTVDRFSFFGVEIEVFQINDSALAPHFNVVAKPNDWSRGVGSRIKSIEGATPNPLRQLYLDYWSGLHDYLVQNERTIRPPKPLPQQWLTFGVGRGGFYLNTAFQREQRRIRVELVINGPDKAAFRALQCSEGEITKDYGVPLTWDEMPGRKSSRIALYRDEIDMADRSTWADQFRWYADQVKTFRRVFTQRLRALDEMVDSSIAVGNDQE
ncbi:DUF4268 domain-containing protein [Bradyrhizobium sp. 186]|uniref:DUF4268 domain-containing protein n=1 Tax=Bradyrhizobium sp. 186 TaxID=2782654 RepID=UPI0020013584|nr:DUF4268 domain-containing protein [Bradyrhizobium sp. 186]UPK35477.1 DUF4268 domain-containing protein [Bradyrhizobium sp. 186]